MFSPALKCRGYPAPQKQPKPGLNPVWRKRGGIPFPALKRRAKHNQVKHKGSDSSDK